MDDFIKNYGLQYLLIGAVVSILLLKKLATSLANSTNTWTGSYWASATRTNKVDPGIGDYIGALIWSIILLPFWPVRVLFRLWLMTDK